MNKTVDLSSIKFPDEMPKMDKETYLFKKWIYKISTKRKKNKRLFIITEWEFFVLKKKTFSKKLILSYSFRWYDITSIEYDKNKEEEFTIRFKNDKSKKKKQTIQSIQNGYSKKRKYFTFKYPKAEKMLKMFYSYLYSFHMPEDLPDFNFPDDFLFPLAKGSIPDHMRMKLRLNNHRISTTTLNELKKFISSEPTEFNFTQIRGIISNLPIFLERINLVPSINTLIIPFDVNFNSLEILNDFLPYNENITSLIFKDKLPENKKFSEFKKIFLSTQSTENIISFKFINSKFSKDNVNEIFEIIRHRTIKTLQLKNSLGPITLKPFIQKIYDNPGFQSITNFTLDHTQSIDIRTLLPYLKNVTNLTLIHCEFEIADFFDVIDTDYSMTTLNISQNNNDKQIFHSISFPRHLATIVLRDIKWELLSLSNFIESIMNHRPISNKEEIGDNQIKLDLSQLRMSDEDWSSFFSQIEEKPRGSIISLGWDDNPIDRRFVNFINSFLNLSSLSLNGCIIRQKEDFDSLLKFIADSTSLTSLSIHGTELQNLGKNVMAVIDTLYVNRSIRKIDINNHECGNNILLKLTDVMLQNRVVDEIFFSTRNSISDVSLFELFFIVVGKNRGKPLYTEFPSSFTKSALQFGAINMSQYDKLKYDYEVMVSGRKEVKIPPLTVQRSKNKKFVFKNYNDNPSSIDYDENAGIRRKQIESKFKLLTVKKVELPSSSNLVEDDKKDDIEDDVDDGDVVVDDPEKAETNTKKKKAKRKSPKKSKVKSDEEKVDGDVDNDALNEEEKSNKSTNDGDLDDGLTQDKTKDEEEKSNQTDDFKLDFDLNEDEIHNDEDEIKIHNDEDETHNDEDEIEIHNDEDIVLSGDDGGGDVIESKKSKKKHEGDEMVKSFDSNLSIKKKKSKKKNKKSKKKDDEVSHDHDSLIGFDLPLKNPTENEKERQKDLNDEFIEYDMSNHSEVDFNLSKSNNTKKKTGTNKELNDDISPQEEKSPQNKNKKAKKSEPIETNEKPLHFSASENDAGFDFLDENPSFHKNSSSSIKKDDKKGGFFDDDKNDNPLARSIDEINAELGNLALSAELENEEEINFTKKDDDENSPSNSPQPPIEDDEESFPMPPNEPEIQVGNDYYEDSGEPQTMLPSDIETFEHDNEQKFDDENLGKENSEEKVPDVKFETNAEFEDYEEESNNEFVF